ncbi:murein hydrolase activator EnvC family protein [Pseudocnuella soli]|uniref:murein hydrolase activator EnvC family protein n=1 Tax=Pseudocnuella soli TaxID=2502779 RepID=UPI0010430C31|nr:peptidoglycan DD-metalloendopeptidase family protein [Pseudocnuella soli]
MKKWSALLFFLFVAVTSFGQVVADRSRMERERAAIQKEISEIQSQYTKVKGQRKETLGQLAILQKKLALQNQYINNISKEIKVVNDEIYLSTLEINRLQRQLDTLRQQYARSVTYAYKNRSNYDYLNFIFSASSFNDALKRVKYLKSYRGYRQQQVDEIVQTQHQIEDRKNLLLGKKNEKNAALANQTKQQQVLAEQKKETDVVANKLRSQESSLSKQLAEKRKRDQQLKGAIAAVVRREIEAARKRAEEEERRRVAAEKERLAKERAAKVAADKAAANKAAEARKNTGTAAATPAPAVEEEEPVVKATPSKPVKSYLDLNEKDVALNAGFANNRGKLPWPVDNGVVSIPFGTSKVGSLTFDNPGITIGTPSAGASVKAIFDGEVSSVANLGDGMTVMVRHGKYFTVYSNLSSATVSKGMAIKTGQVIGRSGPAEDGSGGQIDLLLMVESKNVNPEPWLR